MKLMIITGSARKSGVGDRVGAWVQAAAKQQAGLDVELVSVADLNLPLFDEEFSPKYKHYSGKDYANAAGKAWAERVGAADAFVFVTPEYNHSVPAALKNALDWVGSEWSGKPVGLVGYSIVPFGGVRAVEHLRQIVAELGLHAAIQYVLIGDVANVISEEGVAASEATTQALDGVLSEVAKLSTALKA